MFEDYEGDVPSIISASFADPYLLLIMSNSTINILEADDRGDIDEVEGVDDLKANEWITGSLYTDLEGAFLPKNATQQVHHILMFLMNSAGALKV